MTIRRTDTLPPTLPVHSLTVLRVDLIDVFGYGVTVVGLLLGTVQTRWSCSGTGRSDMDGCRQCGI